MLATFSRITLTIERSPKILGLLTAVGAWPRAVICLSVVHTVNSWEHTYSLAYFDPAHAVNFDPTVLNLVAIMLYIMTINNTIIGVVRTYLPL